MIRLGDGGVPRPERDRTESRKGQFTDSLRRQFRALVKALTGPAPKPISKRRRTGETVGTFQLVARSLLRPIIQQPQVLKTLNFLNDAIPWLHLWSWIESAEHGVADAPPGPEGDHLSP